MKQNYEDRFITHIQNTNYNNLSTGHQVFFKTIALQYQFSFQELKQLIDFTIDFKMWNEKDIVEIFKDEYNNRKSAFNHIRDVWNELKSKPNTYDTFDKSSYSDKRKITFEKIEKDTLSLGACPVASPNTRCCNLMTLDSVESCGFDCSYCSIQSFYNQNKVAFDVNFAQKLKNLKLDP
ncbi:MAG: hypothetical protein HRT43_04320, partial [Campylobacteraceae bacterium]|nr:hypothetical protein [Campylobacteraceae bacterium]